MNLFMVFVGGLCALTGAYGIYDYEANLFLIISTIWGSFIVGYYIREAD